MAMALPHTALLHRNLSRWVVAPLLALLVGCHGAGNHYSGNPEQAYLNTKAYFDENSSYDGPPLATANLSVGKIDLGKKLFRDKRLSADGSFACATCHVPTEGYTQNGRAMPRGALGGHQGRNAPSLYDVALRKSFNLDGAAASLEEQVVVPLTAAHEMANGTMENLVLRVEALPDYARFFSYAYDGDISDGTIRDALVAYQLTLITGPNRFDKWQENPQRNPMNADELAGFTLFTGKARCANCHRVGTSPSLFTDNAYHDTGYSLATGATDDLGRMQVTKEEQDRYAFRTPSLRNVALTGPYMHDGGLASLSDVVTFFNDTENLALTDKEKQQLIAFLNALTSKRLP